MKASEAQKLAIRRTEETRIRREEESKQKGEESKQKGEEAKQKEEALVKAYALVIHKERARIDTRIRKAAERGEEKVYYRREDCLRHGLFGSGDRHLVVSKGCLTMMLKILEKDGYRTDVLQGMSLRIDWMQSDSDSDSDSSADYYE